MNEVRKKKYNPAIISVSLCEIFAQKSTNQAVVKKKKTFGNGKCKLKSLYHYEIFLFPSERILFFAKVSCTAVALLLLPKNEMK